MRETRQLDVLHLSASLSRKAGGIFESILGFGHGLDTLGLKVAALGLEDSDSHLDIDRWNSVKPYFVDPLGPSSFGFSPQFMKHLNLRVPRLVHQHGLWMYISAVGLNWTQQNSVPRLISPHGMLEPWALRHSRFKKLIAKTLYEKHNILTATCLHALNEQEANDIRTFGYKGPIAIIPNGSPVPLKLETVQQGNQVSDNRFDVKTLLFLGRLHPKKGLSEAISAFAILKNSPTFKNNPWRFIIAGNGSPDYEARLGDQVAKLDLQMEISFTGPVYGAEKARLFSTSDAFILPSFSEGLPIAVLEAWTYALPTLLTRHCNLNEAIGSHIAVEIPNIPSDMAQKLIEFTELPTSEIQLIGARAKEFVDTHYSWDSSCSKMKSVTDWLTRNGDKPDCIV